MKKKLSYRDKLLELAYIYNVKEIQDYTKRRKNLTTGQIELILKKNKIVIPKEFKTNFFKENFSKPISKLKSNIIDYKEEKVKDKNRFFRKVENYKYDTTRKVNYILNNIWKGIGLVGIVGTVGLLGLVGLVTTPPFPGVELITTHSDFLFLPSLSNSF